MNMSWYFLSFSEYQDVSASTSDLPDNEGKSNVCGYSKATEQAPIS